MAGKVALRYLPVAVDDLTAIFDWIASDNPAKVAAFIDQLDRSIQHLQSHPFLGRIPRDEKLQIFGYRVLASNPTSYSISFVGKPSKFTESSTAPAI